jgi:hypothetical protein
MIGFRSSRSGRLAIGGALLLLVGIGVGVGASAAPPPATPTKEQGLAAFETVKSVLQNPRCQNCHIPGDAPLQLDAGRPHTLGVLRGPEGKGAPGLACGTCHADGNPPASYGAHMPPGAPDWHLPPPERKMVFIGLSSGDLCRGLKDTKSNGGKDLAALTEHMASDKLVGWGWNPGVGRQPVPIARDEVVAKFKIWVAAGAPCAP